MDFSLLFARLPKEIQLAVRDIPKFKVLSMGRVSGYCIIGSSAHPANQFLVRRHGLEKQKNIVLWLLRISFKMQCMCDVWRRTGFYACTTPKDRFESQLSFMRSPKLVVLP